MKGKFKNFNQGELRVYSLDGRGKIDTVRLADGKFTYEIPLEDTLTLSVVFPNFSEIPVIAVPGTSVKMEGDASHLREVAVSGTDENELLTQFRLNVAEQTPPEAVKAATSFISDHPASLASKYVLNKYFLLKSDADFSVASKLISKMVENTPGNRRLLQLQKQALLLQSVRKGDALPNFTAITTTGSRVSNSDLYGDVNIISVWTSWNYESMSIQRQLRQLQRRYGSRLQLLSISIDGNPADCRETMRRDSLNWSVVCDGNMWNTPVVQQLGFYAVPDNIVTDRSGKIIDRHLSLDALKKKIEEIIK